MANSSPYPGWAYMLAGLAIGLFIAFLFYLHHLPEPQSNSSTNKNSSAPPQFDFYTILPELEVVVPDIEAVKEKLQNSTKPADSTTNTELLKGQAFVLQVGSFKEAEQADRLKATLALLGLEAHVQTVKVDNNTWHRVRLGPFENQQALNAIKQRLKENAVQSITLKINS